MSNNWFTSDTHFYHKNIIRFCNRPFKDEFEMNEKLIENWNAKVKPNDNLFHLGDFGFADVDRLDGILSRLNGRKTYVMGNHDKQMRDAKIRRHFTDMTNYKEIRINDQKIILFHFPIAEWNKEHHGSFHFHGHVHDRYKSPNQRIMDVGVDTWNYAPVEFEELKALMLAIPVPQTHHTKEGHHE